MDLVCKSYFFYVSPCLLNHAHAKHVMNMPLFCATNKPNGLGASQPVAHAQDLLLTELPQGLIAWKGDRKTYLFGICAIYLELRVPIEEDLDAFICNCQRVIGIIGTSHVESLQHGQSQTPKRSQLAYRVARVYVYVMLNVSWFSWFMSRWWFQPIWIFFCQI